MKLVFCFNSNHYTALIQLITKKQNDETYQHACPCSLRNLHPKNVPVESQLRLHDVHKKKLQKIRQQRKSNISINQNRLAHIELIKENKNRSFAHKFNQQSSQINRQNLRLLVRLQQTKPYFRYTSHEHRDDLQKSRESQTLATPFIKRRAQEKEKQNLRLNSKVQSISSSLNQRNMMRDFVKSQRIKQRISRYTEQNNKISLKQICLKSRSQKYISHMSQSKLSNSSEVSTVRPRIQSTTANYYKREDIMKNKIENVGKSLMKIKNKLSHTVDQNNEENKNSFFTTEPQKNVSKRKSNRR